MDAGQSDCAVLVRVAVLPHESFKRLGIQAEVGLGREEGDLLLRVDLKFNAEDVAVLASVGADAKRVLQGIAAYLSSGEGKCIARTVQAAAPEGS